jgi:hypothetical protein
MHLIIQSCLLFAAWRWSDWRNWKKYYPTVLFLILFDFFYNVITYNYFLWKFEAVTFDKFIYRNHTLIDLGIAFFAFPSIVLLYLSHYPKGRIKQFFYVSGWIGINTIIELISFYFMKGISYHHSWNTWWSVLVNVLLFVVVRIHYSRPLLAWMISIVASVFFILYFHVPLINMR